MKKPRLVGMNHVALEVADLDAALAFYAKVFDFEVRGRGARQVEIDLGDQFIALVKVDEPHRDRHRHVGIVVDDRAAVRELAAAAGAEVLDGRFLDFVDPWGNRIEVVDYDNVQFSKAPNVLRGMRLALAKNDKASAELAQKGMAEDA
jgi:catechol 2,3-dioxygenase-like lactoylglutathione lyase family enzyme